MAGQLRVYAALAEDPSSVSSIHSVTHNPLLAPISGNLHLHAYSHIYPTQTHTRTRNLKENNLENKILQQKSRRNKEFTVCSRSPLLSSKGTFILCPGHLWQPMLRLRTMWVMIWRENKPVGTQRFRKPLPWATATSLLSPQWTILYSSCPKDPGSLSTNYMSSAPKIKLHCLWSISQEHKPATILPWQGKAERWRSSLGYRRPSRPLGTSKPRAWTALPADPCPGSSVDLSPEEKRKGQKSHLSKKENQERQPSPQVFQEKKDFLTPRPSPASSWIPEEEWVNKSLAGFGAHYFSGEEIRQDQN